MEPATAILAVATVCALVDLTSVLVSLATPLRIWPPGERDWRYWLTWGCWYPGTAGFVALGLLDSGSLGLFPGWVRLVGGAVGLFGLLLALAAVRGLGVEGTEGLEGELRTGGLYRYSRNPQYVGDLLAIPGWVVFTDSFSAALVGSIFFAYYTLLPFTEEPWLKERYGTGYEEYLEETPRFLGLRTLKRLQR